MIMIVDDNASIRAIVASQVRRITGIREFFECDSGIEAIRAYGPVRPDWVLMDIKMPIIDGLTATRAIRREFPEARIVMVTNFDDPDLREAARKVGAAGYVLKDRLSELRTIIACQATNGGEIR